MGQSRSLRLPFEGLIAAAGVGYLMSSRVGVDWFWYVELVNWATDKAMSGGNTRVRLQIGGRALPITLAEQDAPDANVVYTYSKKARLFPGEWLQLELDQAQASTTITGSIIGYAEEVIDNA